MATDRNKPVNARGTTVPESDTGFAVSEGELRIGDDFFEIDLSLEEMHATKEAIRWDNNTPSQLAQITNDSSHEPFGWKGSTFVGDFQALELVVNALKRFERLEAGIGDDKAAYDARTAFNHSRLVVRKNLVDEDD